MKKTSFVPLALAGLFVLFATHSSAATFSEDFITDPLQGGWQVFGDTNSFQWDATNQNLDVTWSSTNQNSYFYHPLGTTLTRDDDFSIAFDLRLNDIASGVEPGKTGSMELGFGMLNFTNATSADFMRGAYGGAPDVAEFDYYPHGYYTDPYYDSPAATVPAFISDDGYDYAPGDLSVYDNVLPTNQWIHIAFTYTASNHTAVVSLATNGVSVGDLPPLALDGANGFANAGDNFSVDTFSVSSYSSAGDYYDSVLAHGSVGNIVVTLPPPAQNLAGAFSNGVWQVQFTDHAGWLYTLECTTNFISWAPVSIPTPGNGTNLFLQDSNPPAENAFYRVSAERP
jgi:hypothetical protein